MKNKTTEQETIEAAGYDCRSYSGRGMYGEKCLAVIIDEDQSEMHFWAELLETVINAEGDSFIVSNMMRKAKTDSMGRGMVIYWPAIEFTSEGDE